MGLIDYLVNACAMSLLVIYKEWSLKVMPCICINKPYSMLGIGGVHVNTSVGKVENTMNYSIA